MARAFNAINGYCIVYINKKPYGIKIQLSEKFIKLSGNSHDVVLSQFKNSFSSDVLLVNNIDNENPIDWFNTNRNFINYTLNPMGDPTPPISLFKYNNNLRNWIGTYLNDTEHIYTFDPSHCYIAYPIQLFNRIYNYYASNNVQNKYLSQDKINYLKNNISDSKGPISVMLTRLNEIALSE